MCFQFWVGIRFGSLYLKSFWTWHACLCAKLLQCVWFLAVLWTVARQAPLSMGFSRQECWSGLPCPPPSDLPDLGILPLLHWQAVSLPLVPPGKPFWTLMVVAQSCLTLCNPMNCCLPDSSLQEILPARILEWVAIPFSKGFSWPRDQTWVSYTADEFFTIWATREVHSEHQKV